VSRALHSHGLYHESCSDIAETEHSASASWDPMQTEPHASHVQAFVHLLSDFQTPFEQGQ
jgi:hypothetical protein